MEGPNCSRQAFMSQFFYCLATFLLICDKMVLKSVEEGNFPQKNVQSARVDLGSTCTRSGNATDQATVSDGLPWKPCNFIKLKWVYVLRQHIFGILGVLLNTFSSMRNCPCVQGGSNNSPGE